MKKNTEKFQKTLLLFFQQDGKKICKKKSYFQSNPGLGTSAAKYLISKNLNLVGIDSPSIDLGKNPKFEVHHILLKNNILVLENLCNLEKIHSVFFKLIVLPLKLKNTTGSPVRAVAI